MQLDASADEPSVTVGNEMTVTAIVTNNGPDDATSVRVSSTLPDGTSFVSATPSAGSCVASAEGLLDCELGDMAAEAEANVVLILTADEAGAVDVSLSAGADETDPDVQNNTNSADITVNEPGGSSGCSCTVGASDLGGNILLSLSVLGFLLWRRRRSNIS
jgi:uncharacterized repeat protein (TIGR01451 family)/MYXO-CTERM domain-containing protein